MSEIENCLNCNSSEILPYQKKSYLNLPVFVCNGCGLYFSGQSEKQRREHSIQEYDNHYWDERDSVGEITADYLDDFSIQKKRDWISQRKYCQDFMSNKHSILEIGSGAGHALHWFENDGFDVTGIEPDKRNVDLINKKLKNGKCIASYGEEMELDEQYDVIWIHAVLKNTIRPDIILKKVHSALKNDGFLFIEVRNCDNPEVLKESINEHPNTFHFTKKTFLEFVQRFGFRVEKCDYIRAATKFEGLVNKLSKKRFPYYPRISTTADQGIRLRGLFTKNAL